MQWVRSGVDLGLFQGYPQVILRGTPLPLTRLGPVHDVTMVPRDCRDAFFSGIILGTSFLGLPKDDIGDDFSVFVSRIDMKFLTPT